MEEGGEEEMHKFGNMHEGGGGGAWSLYFPSEPDSKVFKTKLFVTCE